MYSWWKLWKHQKESMIIKRTSWTSFSCETRIPRTRRLFQQIIRWQLPLKGWSTSRRAMGCAKRHYPTKTAVEGDVWRPLMKYSDRDPRKTKKLEKFLYGGTPPETPQYSASSEYQWTSRSKTFLWRTLEEILLGKMRPMRVLQRGIADSVPKNLA